jgi:acetolactate synthase-1/2/3 large subunit
MSSIEVSAAIVDALREAGADTVFGIPGGGNNLDFIGAVEAAGMRFVLAHAETPAAMMAGAYADLTGRPSACVLTRGPGAASAVNGVANALLERQPMVVVTDAVSSADYERIAHQRLDQRTLFAQVTKWSATAGTDAQAVSAHAVATATRPPCGPVHLDFDPTAPSTPVPAVAPATVVCDADLNYATRLLAGSRRPVVLLGVGARGHEVDVRALLESSSVPVLMTYRAKGVVPDSWPNAAGLLTGATTEAPLLEAADLIVMIGVDTVEFFPNPWPYAAPVLSIASWAETNSYLTIDVELVGEVDKLVRHVAEHWPTTTWVADAGNRHRDFELQRLLVAGPAPVHGLAPQAVVLRARAAAPVGTIATVDAGAHMLPAMCLWPTEANDEVLISSGLATMGYAVPAAIGAALARPGRRVVALTGDGGLGMCVGELETIRRLDLPITVVVFNDARLSLIAIKAKPDGNGGEGAVAYTATDFAQVGEGYGLLGLRVETLEQLDDALTTAIAHEGPSLVDVRVDPSAYREILAVIRGARDPEESRPQLVQEL